MVDPEDHKATKNKIHKAIVALGYPITILPPLLSLELPDLDTGVYPQVIVLCHYCGYGIDLTMEHGACMVTVMAVYRSWGCRWTWVWARMRIGRGVWERSRSL